MSEPLMALCTSTKMQPIRDLISKVAGTNTTVLLRGESGTGKEVLARAIHKASPRTGKQFLKVNCAALPGELLESELFGGEKIIDTDVRLIAATNRDLEASMRAHQFREDLYYRLNVIEIRIPPLRERRDEIAPLVDFFLRKFNAQYGRSVEIPPDTMRVLVEYHWPGNIRELENA